ncbi:MAG: endonuclease, partial [Prevotellaceae bacterium]|nr:endonuclease [Prevotellaceae bacterium]
MRKYLSFVFLFVAVLAYAQGPNGTGNYYRDADGKKGKALKTALHDIINSHTTISYNGLWDCYKTTDVRADGKIWDMYSNITNYRPGTDQAGNYSAEGDCYNREHSMPKSWFGDASPMVSDLMHIFPTDAYVNGRRSNYPFGETNGESYKSANGFSKLGKSTTPGYSGTVFEPNDEYKGDFARIYFYMVTCYENSVASWSSDMLANNKYPAFKTWALDMLLRWAKEDPVSEKEINRNNAVYNHQHNRNPFVDYPGLEQYVWGSNVDKAFSFDNYDSTVDPGTDPGT